MQGNPADYQNQEILLLTPFSAYRTYGEAFAGRVFGRSTNVMNQIKAFDKE
jgi:hypothetical protein